MRSEFDRRLHAIEARVTNVFGMVAEDVPRATHALLGGRAEEAAELAGREQAIDTLYPEIEEFACREILLQAPVASDLRFLLSVLRIVPELERSHDLVMQIASGAGRVHSQDLSSSVRGLTERMGDLASRMWRQTANSWRTRDGSAALALGARESEMNQLHSSLTAELASGVLSAPVTMEMTLVARCYDRLGAHAVNITRRVAYLAGPATR
jgi:phosphate transport system protein